MFTAIKRYTRALGYLVTGRIDAARQAVSSNPHVVRATFDRIIEEKRSRIHQFKDAVGRMIAQQEQKLSRLKTLTDEVNRLEQLKEGAAAKARTVVRQKQAAGESIDTIKSGEDYLKCMTAFNDFTTTAAEKSERIAEIEADVKELETNIAGHKVQLQQLVRELDKLKEESATTVADLITAGEEQEIADLISGISADRSSRELEDLRELRSRSRAKARVSQELAGTDTQAQEAEFLEYARTSKSASEFDRLIGLAEHTDAAERGGADRGSSEREGRLPEG